MNDDIDPSSSLLVLKTFTMMTKKPKYLQDFHFNYVLNTNIALTNHILIIYHMFFYIRIAHLLIKSFVAPSPHNLNLRPIIKILKFIDGSKP